MSASPEDWNAVLERLIDGDRLAFGHFNRLLTGFLVQLRAYDFQEEWDDLRQEVLMAVVANARAGRLRDPQAFVGYVRIITRNKFMDRLKRRLRCHEKDALPWEEETARASLPAAPTPSPDTTSDVRAALSALPEESRRAVEGVYVEGRSYQEVSDALGIPLGTLKRRLRESLARLRLRLQEAGEDL